MTLDTEVPWLMVCLFYLFNRRTGRDPKENIHEMGQQASEEGELKFADFIAFLNIYHNNIIDTRVSEWLCGWLE